MTKKRTSRGRKRASRKKSQSQRPQTPLEDRRLMDQTMASIGSLLEGREFSSIDEINAYLQRVLESGEPLPEPPAETPLQKAQAVMYEAFAAQGRQRVRLARKALKLSQDCADAYVLLAEEAARNLKQANDYYLKGVLAGRRALGQEMFETSAGHFWSIVESRPFMRAMEGYSRTLWWLEEHDASVDCQQEMLRLNPGDNQGVRYFLAHCLLSLRRLKQAEDLFKEYEDDLSAELLYPRALVAFLASGPSKRANRLLEQAVKANPYVLDYLVGTKGAPKELPEFYGLGDDNEAVIYVFQYGDLWHFFSGAVDWLERVGRPFAKLSGITDAGEDGDWDPEYDWMEDDDPFPAFSLDEFLTAGDFPRAEHKLIGRCLAIGISKYDKEVYGHENLGRRSDFAIDEAMSLPYLFGRGAVEVVLHKRIRPASKLKVCRHALEIMNPNVEMGVPYGLLTILGYMASQNQLVYVTLLSAAVALGFGVSTSGPRPNWFEGASQPELLALIDWIARHGEVPADEKLWWAWKLTVQSQEVPFLGKRIADRWLSLEAISSEAKLELCYGWLGDENEVGSTPFLWQLNSLTRRGKFAELRELIEQRELEAPQEVLDALDEAAESFAEPEPGSVEALLMSVRDWVRVPNFLYRLAIPALVRLGEDLETTIEAYWDDASGFHVVPQTQGIADALAEFGHLLPPVRLRQLVERGVTHCAFQTRKAFYMASEKFYGDEFLRVALKDDAGSLRKWASKKLANSG